MSREIELLTEIRDLLQVMAEPALEQRDKKFRTALRSVVAGGSKAAKAVLLMNGSRSQATVAKEAGMDASNLSKLMKKLAAKKLLVGDQKQPQLLANLPPNFFDASTGAEPDGDSE